MTRWLRTFSPAASRDLANVVAIIAEHAGRRAAARWRRTFEDRSEALTLQPLLGAVDEDLDPVAADWSCGPI